MAELTYNQENDLLKKLFLCTQEADIEKTFEDFHIADTAKKITFLRRRMGVEKIYDAPQTGLTEADEYEFECEAFTEGSWRLLN
ncbi:hypothetical protein H0R92_07735 [Treponema sp. OMZ 840]|uniref:hypothetical protein n=1 Tax=Treponema sp. OMZ 840 TaxID=244313 RepID=UPI003D8A8EFA